MSLKSFVFSLLPTKVQHAHILKRSGFRVISSAKLTDNIVADVCIPVKNELWVRRLSNPYGHEPEVMRWFERNLKASDVVFDIGAHFGFYGILALELQPQSKFYGFEASWFFNGYQRLNRNRSVHKENWFCVEKMVGAEDGGDFVSIDGYLKKNVQASVVLMDVDGEECTVLSGAKKAIQDGNTTWLIEVHPRDLAKRNKSQEEVVAHFQNSHYALRYLPNLRNPSSQWSEQISEEDKKEEFFLLATPIQKQRL